MFAMGDDWAGRFDDLQDVCEVMYLPRTRDVSTTDIKGWMTAMREAKVAELRTAVDTLRRMLDDFI